MLFLLHFKYHFRKHGCQHIKQRRRVGLHPVFGVWGQIFSFYHLKQPHGLLSVQRFAVCHDGLGHKQQLQVLDVPAQPTHAGAPLFTSALFQLMERTKHAHYRGPQDPFSESARSCGSDVRGTSTTERPWMPGRWKQQLVP